MSVETLREEATKYFGCPEKAENFLTTPQPAYLGTGANNTPMALAERGNMTTALSLLKPTPAC